MITRSTAKDLLLPQRGNLIQPRATPWEHGYPNAKALKGRLKFMPQSLAKLHVHLIFSTKNRAPIIHDKVRQSLHSYMATVLANLGCSPVLINSTEDHVHLLFDLGRTVTASKAVEDVKKSSSRWIKTQGPDFAGFAWQAGYGALAVSESNVSSVCAYIAKQKEHHQTKSFQEEYRTFLKRHGIVYDERYVWD